MSKKDDHGIYKLVKGFKYAFEGIRDTYKTELNFRIHFFAMLVAMVLGIFLSLTTAEWLWILISITLVMAFELMNTALEALSNSISLEHNPYIKKAKDAAAAAVLVISFFALLTGLLIFLPKIIRLFN